MRVAPGLPDPEITQAARCGDPIPAGRTLSTGFERFDSRRSEVPGGLYRAFTPSGEAGCRIRSRKAVAPMSPHLSHDSSYGADSLRPEGLRQVVRSSFCVMPAKPRLERNSSFVFGRSDSRIRPLLNQEERDRLHCWAMVVALASSAAGTTLLLAAALR